MTEFENKPGHSHRAGCRFVSGSSWDKSNRQYLFIILVTDLLDIEIPHVSFGCSQHRVKCLLGIRTQNCQASFVSRLASPFSATTQLDHAVEVLADLLHFAPAASLAPLGVIGLWFVFV